ncbi:MAG: hypothetical protein H6729_12445 [Deltaproteobacteria bacterium]|nr:hypothetical protein [Deltaproteobacteria bacterium]
MTLHYYYNGAKFDDRYAKPTRFTGELMGRDVETGHITRLEHYVLGVREGPYEERDPRNGALKERGTYRAGKRHGLMQRYDANGALSLEYAYVAGELEGVQKQYEDGILRRVFTTNEQKTGKDTEFCFNRFGQLTYLHCGRAPASAEDAAWCGRSGEQSTVSLYDDEGRLVGSEQYLNGARHGFMRTLSATTGQVIREKWFINGVEQVSGQRNYDAAGSLLRTTEEAPDGTWTETLFYARDDQERSGPGCTPPTRGQKQTVTTRRAGQLLRVVHFFENGQTREEAVHLGDDLFLIARYDDEGRLRQRGPHRPRPERFGAPWLPDGEIEHFGTDGSLLLSVQFEAGRRHGVSKQLWVDDGRHFTLEFEYVHDRLSEARAFLDGALVGFIELERDGSLKSRVIFDEEAAKTLGF